ncbi:alkaline phosphatase family protein [Dyadobacter sp. 32]|uniref:alkaline phosphatase family protein n=1 Tax=Dyadobacter sp. 32 TaxID=538966 RepID=UPI0011EDF2A4
MKIERIVATVLVLAIAVSAFAQYSAADKQFKTKTLIVFFDGLRPDYITEELMPHLSAFRKDACYGARHHSVFPTVTRVNSSSYATGSYPGTHGLLGNAVYFPEISKVKATGTTYEQLSKVKEAISGPLLTAVSLGEVLQTAGKKMMVFSSGTTGQAFLQNHTVNGAIINPDLILPETFKPTVIQAIGKAPGENESDDNARHKWITDGLLKFGLSDDGPLVSAIWFSDPDGAAHSHGIGSDEAVAAIKYVDGQFGRIMEELKNRGLSEKFNVIVSTDHGFVTHVGKVNLSDFLIKEGLKKAKDSDDVVIAEGGIYVKDHDQKLIEKIVNVLHQEEWVGAVFTKPVKSGDDKGWVDGTLSFDAIHYNHARAGDILVAMNWNDEKNGKGYAGAAFAGGVAGHGGSSPYEINIALYARGPAFKRGFTSTFPTSNVDIAPTVLKLYNLPIPVQMNGRAVSEFMLNSKPVSIAPKKANVYVEKSYPWGIYKLTLERTVFGKYQYVDCTKVVRSEK